MGEVVQLSDYQKPETHESAASVGDCLVPIEFAVGFENRKQCIVKIARYGVQAIHVRMVNDEPETMLYFIGVEDAIDLNKKILELEELSEEEITKRIDLIQMLENVDLRLMHNMWESFTCQSST